MATNSSRGNPIAARDGPPVETTQSVPRVPAALKAEIARGSGSGSGGSSSVHAGGQDAGSVAPGAHVETVEETRRDETRRGSEARRRGSERGKEKSKKKKKSSET